MNRYDVGRWFGAVLVVVGAAAVAATYPPELSLGAQAAALAAAGVLFVLAGTPNRLRDRVGPHRLMGVGDVVLGASIVVSGLAGVGGDDDLVYLAATLLGGASLALVGLLYVFRPTEFGLGEDGYPESSTR
ncbi:MAG: hypothetical protein ABEJ88_02905 [Halobacterium sp.]